MKIDILDDYIRTPEWFRGLSDIYRSTEGLPEPPGESNGPTWAIGEREGSPQGVAPPSHGQSELDKGCSPFFLLPLPLFPPYSY